MIPKEKAEELVHKFHEIDRDTDYHNGITMQNAKQCALIAVDEIIHYLEIILGVDKTDFRYWYEVKEEIEKL